MYGINKQCYQREIECVCVCWRYAYVLVQWDNIKMKQTRFDRKRKQYLQVEAKLKREWHIDAAASTEKKKNPNKRELKPRREE